MDLHQSAIWLKINKSMTSFRRALTTILACLKGTVSRGVQTKYLKLFWLKIFPFATGVNWHRRWCTLSCQKLPILQRSVVDHDILWIREPRIRTTDPRIRILLFPKWLTRCQQKIIFFHLFCFLFSTFWRCIYISLQRWKVKKNSQNSRNQCTNNDGSGSGNPQKIRSQIHNTAARYKFSFLAKRLNSSGRNYSGTWEDPQSVS